MSSPDRTIRREMARNAGMKISAATTGRVNPYGTRKATRGTYEHVWELALRVSGNRLGLARRLLQRMDIQKPARAA